MRDRHDDACVLSAYKMQQEMLTEYSDTWNPDPDSALRLPNVFIVL
jgi:hypothetical protein